jgi:hypothetical protein
MGLLRNKRKTPFSISANTKTRSRKYGNGWKNIENGTGRYGKNFVCFHESNNFSNPNHLHILASDLEKHLFYVTQMHTSSI